MAKRRSAKASATVIPERPAARAVARTQASGIDPMRGAAIAGAAVEGGCLAAVAILPLYFSFLTTTVWETDKAVTLIALAAIVALGLLARIAFVGLPIAAGLRPTLLVWAAVAVFATYALATALSIAPWTSLYGSLERHQGLLTHGAYLVFFLAALTTLRRPQSIDRLMTVLVFTSLPPVVYGLLQQIGYDPLPAGGDPAVTLWPVRSSFGDHIFFGAYLVLIIPLTAARVLKYARPEGEGTDRSTVDHLLVAGTIVVFAAAAFLAVLAMVSHIPAISALFPLIFGGYALLGLQLEALPDSVTMRRVRLWGYGALLALQIIVLLFTSARGPWFGSFATIPVVGLLLAYRLNRPRLWWSALGITLAGAIFVVLLNVANGPLQPLRSVRGLDHIANIVGTDSSDSSVRGRLQVWKGVSTLITTHPSIGNTWGGAGRDITGYGPDTLRFAFNATYPLKLRRDTVETYTLDRSHDIYLDTMVDAGLLGLLALLCAVALYFRRTIAAFIDLHSSGTEGTPGTWILIGAIAAIAGHLVEGVFGIETAVTLLIFWLLLGIAAGWRNTREANGLDMQGAGGVLPGKVRRLELSLFLVWGIAIVLTGVFLLAAPGIDHPGLFATIWLLGLIAVVACIAYALLPPREGSKGTERGRQAKPAPVVPRPPSWMRIGALVLGLLSLGVLISQWRFQTAAIANTAGSTDFAQGNLAGGLGDAEEAARYAPYVASYDEDLGSAYFSLARMRANSAEPTYRPGGSDDTTIDPSRAITFGNGQLTELGFMALRAAQRTEPLDPTVNETLGNAYLGYHRPRLAIASFTAAQQLAPNNPRYYADEALALLALSRPGRAVVQATAAINLDPRFWYSHYALAEIAHAVKNRALARQQASATILWAPIAYPPPPAAQLAAMRKLARTG